MNGNYFYLFFWLIISLLVFILFGSASGNYEYAFYFLTFFMPVAIITSRMFTGILIPRYLLKRKYGKFFLYSFYTILVSLDLELLLVFAAFILISYYDYENLGAIIDSYKWMPVVLYFIVILAGFINLVLLVLGRKDQVAAISGDSTIMVRSERRNRRIRLENIRYIESMSDYIRIFLENGETIVTRERISELHQRLPGEFIRIHRSYIINIHHLTSFNREEVFIGESVLPVSRTYRKEAIGYLEEHS